MTNLTKHETVWLQAYCAAIARGEGSLMDTAESVVNLFNNRFPPSPPPQKEPVTTGNRREFWCCPDRNDDYRAPYSRPLFMSDEVHFVELREGEVIVTKEMLAKAWDDEFGDFGLDHSEVRFDHFCKALGIGHE